MNMFMYLHIDTLDAKIRINKVIHILGSHNTLLVPLRLHPKYTFG
jgi:hypothetical protein